VVDDLMERLARALSGHYRIEREIGAGGMAKVFLAEDLRHERMVALKTLRQELALILGSDRFLREIKLASRLDHPHILPIHDSGEAGGILYYTMPFVEGESLRTRLERESQLPLDETLRIGREVADALGYAHAHEVVHRDIKPENILLSAGHARVTDFGIARAIHAAGGNRLTATGLVLGTPAYMSPEQAAGEDLDGRTDLYSLGCVLYEMVSGSPPFTGPTVQIVTARRLAGQITPLHVLRRSVPAWLEGTVARALKLNPCDRFETAERFEAALEPPPPSPQPTGKWLSRLGIAFRKHH
jgi:eukaryotic-like serine/threonine-protein kinase